MKLKFASLFLLICELIYFILFFITYDTFFTNTQTSNCNLFSDNELLNTKLGLQPQQTCRTSFVEARRVRLRRRKMRKDQRYRYSSSVNKNDSNLINAPEIIKWSFFENDFAVGQRIYFICIARGNPTPRVRWFKDSAEFVQHFFSRISEYQMKDNTVKSMLDINPTRHMDAGLYECHASNVYSTDRRSFKADFEEDDE